MRVLRSLSAVKNMSTCFSNTLHVESWILSNVLKPSMPYFVVKFLACSMIKLSVEIKLYFSKVKNIKH